MFAVFTWKNLPKDTLAKAGIYFLSNQDHSDISAHTKKLTQFQLSATLELEERDGYGETKFLRGTSSSSLSPYCILQEEETKYPTTIQAFTCILDANAPATPIIDQGPSGDNTSEMNRSMIMMIVGIVGGCCLFAIIAGIIGRRIQKRNRERYGTEFRTNEAIEMHSMDDNVQMFPVQPSVQTYQPVPLQDPLMTLSPVYTSTYVQPTIQG